MTESTSGRSTRRQRAVPTPAATPLDVPPPSSPQRPPAAVTAAPPPQAPPAQPPAAGTVIQRGDDTSTTPDAMQASMLAETDTTPALLVARDDGAAGLSVSLAALMGGAPDPEMDLVPVTLRLPRYVANTLKTESTLTRRSQQVLATEALKSKLSPQLLDQGYLNASGRPRPNGQ